MDKMDPLEQSVVETSVLGHLLFLMASECVKGGYELRADVKHKLNVAAAAPLKAVGPARVKPVAEEVDRVARALLHDLSPDDPRHGLYVCAMFVLVLVDEGLFIDVMNVAVGVSMLLIDDVKTEDDTSHFTFKEYQLKRDAKKLLRKIQLMGYFPTIPVAPTQQI